MTDNINIFTFGEIEEVSQSEIIQALYAQSYWNQDYYEPPIQFERLLALQRQQAHHESALDFKATVLSSLFKTNRFLEFDDFEKIAQDYLILGNAFISITRNRAGGVHSLNHLLAKTVRVGKKGEFYQLKEGAYSKINSDVIHIKKHDSNQTIYGMPSYLSALLSVELNRSATMFRLKYYKNGSHAGFILNVNGDLSEESKDAIKKQLQESKGAGNFKNILIFLPNGDKSAINLIPISEVTAKDEFLNIKNCTRDDIATVHRVPLVLMSIQPTNAGGFGKPEEHALVFNTNEIKPLTKKFKALNEKLNVKAFDFDDYSLA